MICSECKKRSAEFHVKAVYEGLPYKKDLCAACAQRLGLLGALGDPTDDAAAPALKFPTGSPLLAELFSLLAQGTPAPVRSCPQCRWTLNDLRRTGHMGCPACYAVFFDDLRDVIKKVHGHLQHKGKPAPAPPPRPKPKAPDAIAELRKELERSIKEERFEAAAAIRDRLRALEEALRRRGPG